MNDSGSFSSLFALVDSHLSQCSVQEKESLNPLGNPNKSIAIPLNNAVRKGLSDPRLSLSQQKYMETSSAVSVSPIKSVLNEQIMNMLRAKENKRLHSESLETKLDGLKLENEEPLIDLMQAIEKPVQIPVYTNKALSTSSSTDSLNLYENFPMEDDVDKESDLSESEKSMPKLLPCKKDMSYILYKYIRRGKCSTFGRIVSAKLKPVPTPYLREVILSDIVPFNFKTKSPCDLIKDKINKHPSLMEMN